MDAAAGFLTATVGMATGSMTQGANMIDSMIVNITSDSDIIAQCGDGTPSNSFFCVNDRTKTCSTTSDCGGTACGNKKTNAEIRLRAAATNMASAVTEVNELIGSAMSCATVNDIYATAVYDGICTDLIEATASVWQSSLVFAFLFTFVLWNRWLVWPSRKEEMGAALSGTLKLTKVFVANKTKFLLAGMKKAAEKEGEKYSEPSSAKVVPTAGEDAACDGDTDIEKGAAAEEATPAAEAEEATPAAEAPAGEAEAGCAQVAET